MVGQRLQITLEPTVLQWARARAELSEDDLAGKMQVKPERVLEWENSGNISMAQVKRLARATYTPYGYLFLSEPPEDTLPIADFRSRHGEARRRPSPNLLDTVYAMQRRQEWMREEVIRQYEEPPLPFVGAFALTDDPAKVAEAMRDALDIADGWAEAVDDWSEALRHLREKLEDAGILVVFNGVVGNNTSRKLDRDEFQGFALVDEYAPLVFINNTDFKAAQMFTLAHELAHIFAGQTGLSYHKDMQPTDNEIERICDRTTAEFLVPEEEFHTCWGEANRTSNPYRFIARKFKVSSIVAARRALDFGLINLDAFFDFYNSNKFQGSSGKQSSRDGGNFWNTQLWRIGRRFPSMVFRAAKEGRLTYTEAYSLTDLKGDTFEKIPENLEASR